MSTNNHILHINDKIYCAFCGNEIERDSNRRYLCQCKDAVSYRKAVSTKIQMEIEMIKLMDNAPKPKYGIKTIIAPINECVTTICDTDDVPSNPM